MSNSLTERKDLGSLFGSFTDDQIDLIKKTVCRNSTDNELKLFLYTSKHAGLDPLLKQIYAIKRGNTMTIQTSIDGLRLIAERTGRYAPGEETKFAYNSHNEIVSATAYVKKMTADGTWHQVSATAYFDEYCQKFNGKPSTFWQKMPHVMLSKCGEANALRKAFPFELAGLYSSEEMVNGINKARDEDEFLSEEIIGSSPQDEVDIDIPEGADLLRVEKYIAYIADSYSQTVPVIKKWINEKPKKFWEAFEKWEEKQNIDTAEEEKISA